MTSLEKLEQQLHQAIENSRYKSNYDKAYQTTVDLITKASGYLSEFPDPILVVSTSPGQLRISWAVENNDEDFKVLRLHCGSKSKDETYIYYSDKNGVSTVYNPSGEELAEKLKQTFSLQN